MYSRYNENLMTQIEDVGKEFKQTQLTEMEERRIKDDDQRILSILPIVNCESACQDHQDTACMDNMIRKKGKSVLGSRPYRQCVVQIVRQYYT